MPLCASPGPRARAGSAHSSTSDRALTNSSTCNFRVAQTSVKEGEKGRAPPKGGARVAGRS
ncbi:hypothetical protein SLNWT_1697 [Streptomyces albus]|uniref:Uncharacterized protein n=1 Tax=Streptomyces albus (strain ATCC 21838 / DSM 41398 / FERM P-419 / JCM 4703 / NBRC 107858) TaxID=1081613 RepID=A0A0B5EIJ8_STRA4|nr:hypothetical protein SLNWT_1697 [Streptomyces albus]AOU76390.1 hypothetical protein SLNHY_1699 [Streptomyces albus]AYN32175.1 hypothetical protein DUI70_1672 [Streptomyces albus]